MTALKRFEDRTGKVPTVISDIFGGVLQSQVKCLTCQFESNKRDVFMDLSLDLAPATHSVTAALQAFTMPERLDGANKYRCERCKKLSPARKQMQVLRAPNVLVIQLKRFENICGGKITRHVAFSETLTLGGVMAPGSGDPPPEYDLYALIVHEGSTQQLGHYYACAKVARRWYCFNDSSVHPVRWEDVSRQGAYILFYLRTRPPGSVFFYPPRSRGSEKETSAGAARVHGPQPLESSRGPIETPASVARIRTGTGSAAAGPLYGPQLPPAYQGPVETPASDARVRTDAGSAAAGPLYGPQLPPGGWSSVEAPETAGTGRVAAGNGAAPTMARPVYGPQLPLVSQNPLEAPETAGIGRVAVGNGATPKIARPVYGPQMPPVSQGPVEVPEAAGKGRSGSRNGAAVELGRPLSRPQLPPSHRGPVGGWASAEAGGAEERNTAAAPPAGPVFGPQLPSGHRGPLELETGAGCVQTEGEGNAALPPAGRQSPSASVSPIETGATPGVAGRELRDEGCTLSAGPCPELRTGSAVGQTNQSNDGSGSQREGPPVQPAPQPPTPPETSAVAQSLASQAVIAESNPGGGSEQGRTGPLLRPEGAVPNAELEIPRSGSPLFNPRNSQGVPGVGATASERLKHASRPDGCDVSMSEGGTGAAGEREPHDLKRRLSGKDALAEPKRKAPRSEGSYDAEIDGRPKIGGSNGEELTCQAARGGPRGVTVGDGSATADHAMPSAAVSRNGTGQDGLEISPEAISRGPPVGQSTGWESEAGQMESSKTEGECSDGGVAATGFPRLEKLSNVGERMSARPQGAVAEDHGRQRGQKDEGGKVEVMDPSAWSLVYSYGSDVDEECEEKLKQATASSPSAPALPVEKRVVDQGWRGERKHLPGLVEAECILQGGAGMGIFGRSKP